MIQNTTIVAIMSRTQPTLIILLLSTILLSVYSCGRKETPAKEVEPKKVVLLEEEEPELPDWIYLSGDTTRIYIWSEIHKRENGYLVWTKWEYKYAQNVDKRDRVAYSKQAYIISKDFTEMADYDEYDYNSDGEICSSNCRSRYRALSFEAIIPETIGYGIAQKTKELVKQKKSINWDNEEDGDDELYD